MARERISVTIAVPTYRNMPSMFFWNFLALQNSAKQVFDLRIIGCDNTCADAARNTIIDNYLRDPRDYLFFLDSDMLVPQNVIELLAGNDKDIVSGMYFGRSQRGETHIMASTKKGDEYERVSEIPEGLMEVDAVGMGCCLIKREVILSLSENNKNFPLFVNKYKSRTEFQSEDYYFCDLARKAGYKIFLDPLIQCGHIGGVIDKNYFLANKGIKI